MSALKEKACIVVEDSDSTDSEQSTNENGQGNKGELELLQLRCKPILLFYKWIKSTQIDTRLRK